jgi:hypothetical protein
VAIEPVLDQNSVAELFRLLKPHELLHQTGIYVDLAKGSHLVAVGGEIVDECIDAKSEEYLCFLKLLEDDTNRPKGDLAPAVLIEKENRLARTRSRSPSDF